MLTVRIHQILIFDSMDSSSRNEKTIAYLRAYLKEKAASEDIMLDDGMCPGLIVKVITVSFSWIFNNIFFI